MTLEKAILEILENRVAHIKSKNVAGATADYSEDVISFYVVGQLKFIGKGAVEKRLSEWFSTLSTILDYEVADVKIESSSDIAYCSCLNHINAETQDGNKLDMWWRETIGFSKQNGKVEITHSHSSVPFDVENGMASIGLKPALEVPKKETGHHVTPGEIAKSLYTAFQNGDRKTLEDLFSDDFTFTSPDDENLTKAEFFEICFPFSQIVKIFEFLKIMENGNSVLVIYRCQAQGMADFENAEYLTIEEGKVKSVRVFYGG